MWMRHVGSFLYVDADLLCTRCLHLYILNHSNWEIATFSRHRIIFPFQICFVMHDGPCAEFTEFTLPFWEVGQTVPWALFQPGSFYVCLQSPWRDDATQIVQLPTGAGRSVFTSCCQRCGFPPIPQISESEFCQLSKSKKILKPLTNVL